jgi:hypothetical protein
MIPNFLIFTFFYILIIFSVIGYGLFFGKLVNKESATYNLGYSGLIGIFFLILYSYISHFFISHGLIHNLILLIIGIFLSVFFIFKNSKNFFFYMMLLIFLILYIGLIIFKTHDDFPYYHFPYSYYLTQNNTLIGIGIFNHGFRTPSSLFYLSSIFYLPFIKYNLFLIPALLILGFVNLILLSKIAKNFNSNKINYLSYLCLLSLAFINIFFYRIQEHGTDRSAQILVFILFIDLLLFVGFQSNFKNNISNILITLGLIISLKSFYILYLLFTVPIFYLLYKEDKLYLIIETIKTKIFLLFLLLFCIILLVNFLNSSCLIYPINFTCFDNLDWSIGSNEVLKMNNWYELWSKGGAGPSHRVENPGLYIQNLNWLSNWISIYFFNKVSDFLLGLLFLMTSFFIIFYSKTKIVIKNNNYIFFIFWVVIILFFEWFFNHPALRYGGYCIIALLLFFPLSLMLEKFKNTKKNIKVKFLIIIALVFTIFFVRNYIRIIDENKKYDYRPIKEVYFKIDANHFRINDTFNNLITNYENCKLNTNICNPKLKPKLDKFYKTYIFQIND